MTPRDTVLVVSGSPIPQPSFALPDFATSIPTAGSSSRTTTASSASAGLGQAGVLLDLDGAEAVALGLDAALGEGQVALIVLGEGGGDLPFRVGDLGVGALVREGRIGSCKAS